MHAAAGPGAATAAHSSAHAASNCWSAFLRRPRAHDRARRAPASRRGWDWGTFDIVEGEDAARAIEKGRITIRLHGQKRTSIRHSVRSRLLCPFGFCRRSPWIMGRLDRQPVVASGSHNRVTAHDALATRAISDKYRGSAAPWVRAVQRDRPRRMSDWG
jgi:hypothetical protein